MEHNKCNRNTNNYETPMIKYVNKLDNLEETDKFLETQTYQD